MLDMKVAGEAQRVVSITYLDVLVMMRGKRPKESKGFVSQHAGRERDCQRVGDNRAGRRPCEHFNLARRVNNNELNLVLFCFAQPNHIVELRRKQIERRHNGPVRAKPILFQADQKKKKLRHVHLSHLLHDLLVVDRRANVNVHRIRKRMNSRIEVDHVARNLLHSHVAHEALHHRCLARPGHADDF